MILIPAAGRGQRFSDAGYDQPKHLIPLDGTPLIRRVADNLRAFAPWEREVKVITPANVGDTRGTAETLTRFLYSCPGELLIGNCDQLLLPPKTDWRRGDGVIFTFPSASPAHSYVLTDKDDRITWIKEKKVITNRAVAGVYWFKSGDSFLKACRKVVKRTDGELYLSHAIQLLLHDLKIYAHDTPTAILGTPEDFQRFEVALSLAS